MGKEEIACFSFSVFPWPWSADCLQRHEAEDTLKTKVVYPTTNPLCLPGLSLGLWSQKKSMQSPVVSVTCHFPAKIGPKIYKRIMTLLKSAPKTWHVGRFETSCSLVSLLGERNVPGISTLALSPAACSQPPGCLRREDLVISITQELLLSLKWRDT